MSLRRKPKLGKLNYCFLWIYLNLENTNKQIDKILELISSLKQSLQLLSREFKSAKAGYDLQERMPEYDKANYYKEDLLKISLNCLSSVKIVHLPLDQIEDHAICMTQAIEKMK